MKIYFVAADAPFLMRCVLESKALQDLRALHHVQLVGLPISNMDDVTSLGGLQVQVFSQQQILPNDVHFFMDNDGSRPNRLWDDVSQVQSRWDVDVDLKVLYVAGVDTHPGQDIQVNYTLKRTHFDSKSRTYIHTEPYKKQVHAKGPGSTKPVPGSPSTTETEEVKGAQT